MSVTNRPVRPSAPPSVPATTDERCCGGPAPQGVDACCVRDAESKRAGGAGCGCLGPEPFPGMADLPRNCC
jgi:hypothetical protein